jgi:hypothetical protein
MRNASSKKRIIHVRLVFCSKEVVAHVVRLWSWALVRRVGQYVSSAMVPFR